MAIIRALPQTEIPVGKYVCLLTSMYDALCGLPRRVTKVSGQRIYVMDKHEEVEEYRSKKSVVFICDTKEEGEALYEVSRDAQMEAYRRQKELSKQLNIEREADISRVINKYAALDKYAAQSKE